MVGLLRKNMGTWSTSMDRRTWDVDLDFLSDIVIVKTIEQMSYRTKLQQILYMVLGKKLDEV